jgi:hypothetical protein
VGLSVSLTLFIENQGGRFNALPSLEDFSLTSCNFKLLEKASCALIAKIESEGVGSSAMLGAATRVLEVVKKQTGKFFMAFWCCNSASALCCVAVRTTIKICKDQRYN